MASIIKVLAGMTLLMLSSGGLAQSPQPAAPYLQVAGDDTERLPLVLTDVDVSIVGVIADVSVRQIFENRGGRPVEAIYVFPGSARSAVYAMTMSIGDRRIEARIREDDVARVEYEQARDSGRTASLLEQVHEGLFRMNVANILAGDRIEVQLRYTELLVPTDGTYSFVFPHTMGDRYASGPAPVDAPTSSAAEASDFSFAINATIATPVRLQSVQSPSHEISVVQRDDFNADVTLDEAAFRTAARRDFRIDFRLSGDHVSTGILLHPEQDGGYFLAMIEPPVRVRDEWVPPREFIFVVDVSGSMHGEPLALSKQLMRDLVATLRPGDRFNLVLFSGTSHILSQGDSLPATPDTIARAIALLDDIPAGGGTELVPALDQAYALRRVSGMARTVVVVTDGQIWADGRAFSLIHGQLGSSNTHALGIGRGVNRAVIERLARAGLSEPFIIGPEDEGERVATRLRSYIDRPVLTGIRVEPLGFDAIDLEPAQVPDLLAQRPVVIVGRYRGEVTGALRVTGRVGSAPYSETLELVAGAISDDHSALRHLWARSRIQRLLDEMDGGEASDTQARKDEVKAIGLSHGLVTPFTSFVAIDAVERSSEAPTTVRQPAVAPETAPAPLAAVPQTAAFARIGGRGHAHAAGSILSIAMAAQSASHAAATALRRVGGFELVLRDGVWTDSRHVPGLRPVLRIRRGSPAYRALLQLRPELGQVLDGDVPVVIVLGSHVVAVAAAGFSTYPAALLERIAAAVPDADAG